jgi:hypothetical protein
MDCLFTAKQSQGCDYSEKDIFGKGILGKGTFGKDISSPSHPDGLPELLCQNYFARITLPELLEIILRKGLAA